MKTFLLLLFSFFLSIFFSGCSLEEIKDKIVGNFADYAKPLEETTSKPDTPARTLPPNPAGCPVWKKNSPNKITQSISLPRGCKYDRVQLLIANQSNLTLNCNGAEFNGIDRAHRLPVGVSYTKENEPLNYGIKIVASESANSHNITIKNCNLNNYLTGIAVLLGVSAEHHADLKNQRNVAATENLLRQRAPKNIKIENSIINYSHRGGIFIGRYITGLVIDHTTIKYTSAAGLYLESGTQNNTIKNSIFSENGHSLYSLTKRARRRILAKDTREGIAIDSSAKNIIQNNIFAKNAGGGIFLYKNCYEHYQLASELPRVQSSDNNLITQNTFLNQKTGVWIASRQSKDLKAFKCGTRRIATDKISFGPKKETIFIYEDFAKHNTVSNNTFENVKHGVVVEDDDNIIKGNIFSGISKFDVGVGTKYRTKALTHPVRNTVIINNQFNSSSKKIDLSFNPVNTTIRENTPDTINN